MNRELRTEIFSRFEAANPHPTTELEFRSPFELLIAVILSAQATDVSVNRATRGLFAAASTPAAMAALGVEGIKPFIRHIGLFNNKARTWRAHRRSSANSLAERCRATVRRLRRCLGWVARPRTWF